MSNRRQFLGAAASATALLALHSSGLSRAARAQGSTPNADRKLKILILGGTGFIGPLQVETALERGYEVTTFNRGNRSGLFGGQVTELVGDRDKNVGEGLTALEGDERWDVVIDNSGYLPQQVRDSVELLAERCGRYLYISTVAVYDGEQALDFEEDGPLSPAPALENPGWNDINGETYGPLKAECDRIVREVMGERATIVRPTYIVGPGDSTDRFTYWVDRIHNGGDVVAPAYPDARIQVVDVRDLAEFVLTLAENGTPGSFNAAGPVYTREGMMWGIRGTVSAEVRFLWPTPEEEESLGLSPPMFNWKSDSMAFSNAASLLAGANYRPLSESTVATLEWWMAQDAERRASPRGWPEEATIAAAIEQLG